MDVRLVMLGDSAWLVEWQEGGGLDSRLAEVHAAVRRLNASAERPNGVLGVIGGYDSLVVRHDPLAVDSGQLRDWILRELAEVDSREVAQGAIHEIPVCYGDGRDLARMAEETGLTEREVVALHCGADYTVAVIGFAPGFPYLTGLPEALRVPRLATPRKRVNGGSVAIAGEQAGIYPCDSPGGWHVLGRTDAVLFDPARVGREALLEAGDRVRFVPVDGIEPGGKPAGGGIRGCGENPECRSVEVLAPGFSTTVQDAGRPGYEHAGVSPGGVLDREAMRVANMLLGNAEDAAVLEMAVKGPVLKFGGDSRVVLAGARAEGIPQPGRVLEVWAGDVLDVGALLDSSRAVLAVEGGTEVPLVMGSRATDVRGRFGGVDGRKLETGDVLATGAVRPAKLPPAVDGVGLAKPVGLELELRLLEGPQADWFGEEVLKRFFSEAYEVTARQDRTGMRLHGAGLEIRDGSRQMRSQPVATGSVQIPPDGRPMVLMAERQTHGGYPQIGCVITADMPCLARAMPGARVRFRRVCAAEARAALAKMEWDFALLRAGLMCRS